MTNTIRLETEVTTKLTVSGKPYTSVSYVVWHTDGFRAFSNYDDARCYFNELKTVKQ